MSFISFLFCSLLIFSIGCKEEALKEPENQDFIYLDYKKRLKASQEVIKTFEESLKSAQKELKNAAVNSMELKTARSEIKKLSKDLVFEKQKERYLELKIESRKFEVREKYMKAFKAGSEWPNKIEIEEYKAQKRLREASRNWSSRVPSFGGRYRNQDVFKGDSDNSNQKK